MSLHLTGNTLTQLSNALVPKWQPSTAYTAGTIVMAPDGSIVKRLTDGTSGSSYTSANWQTVTTVTGTQAQTELATAIAAQSAKVTATTQTADYTLVLADAGTIIEANKAIAITVTIPPETSVAWPAGTILEVFQLGVGQVTVAAGAGVTLTAPLGAKTAMQYGSLYLRKRATDTWVLAGDSTT